MNEILLTNIFFIITGTAILICTILLSVVLYYVIKIVRTTKRIVEKIEAGSESIAEDIMRLREYFLERSFFSMIISKVFGASRGGRRTKGVRTKTDKTKVKPSDVALKAGDE